MSSCPSPGLMRPRSAPAYRSQTGSDSSSCSRSSSPSRASPEEVTPAWPNRRTAARSCSAYLAGGESRAIEGLACAVPVVAPGCDVREGPPACGGRRRRRLGDSRHGGGVGHAPADPMAGRHLGRPGRRRSRRTAVLRDPAEWRCHARAVGILPSGLWRWRLIDGRSSRTGTVFRGRCHIRSISSVYLYDKA